MKGRTGIFGGHSPWELVFAFPWDKLQVLAPAPGTYGCEEPLAG